MALTCHRAILVDVLDRANKCVREAAPVGLVKRVQVRLLAVLGTGPATLQLRHAVLGQLLQGLDRASSGPERCASGKWKFTRQHSKCTDTSYFRQLFIRRLHSRSNPNGTEWWNCNTLGALCCRR